MADDWQDVLDAVPDSELGEMKEIDGKAWRKFYVDPPLEPRGVKFPKGLEIWRDEDGRLIFWQVTPEGNPLDKYGFYVRRKDF